MSVFRFKQFSVDQKGCAMKVNTDGVLLGALAHAADPQRILDVGAGTGVIALMLAQRFEAALIEAIEIEPSAAETAGFNFRESPFAERVKGYSLSFQDFFKTHPARKYNLIVSNPPFFINSLKSDTHARQLARHTDAEFFNQLLSLAAAHLEEGGLLTLIIPLEIAALLNETASGYGLYLCSTTSISSFKGSTPHREVLSFGLKPVKLHQDSLFIYDAPKVYSEAYRRLLKDFLIIF